MNVYNNEHVEHDDGTIHGLEVFSFDLILYCEANVFMYCIL